MQDSIFIPPDARNLPLSQLSFSVRLQNILSKLGYVVLGDLHEVSYDHIMKKYTCGLKTIKELEAFISKLGSSELEGAKTYDKILKRNSITIPSNAKDWPLAQMSFSVRLTRILGEMGIERLGGLNGISYDEILAAPSCGKKSINELKSFISRLKAGEISLPKVEDVKPTSIFIPQHTRGWSLTQLPMSNRLANVLNKMGFRLLGDLQGVSYREVWSIKNSGRKSVAELEDLVNRLQGGEFDYTSMGDEGLALTFLVRSIDATIEKLPSRERDIFLIRFGGTGDQPMTLRDIGDKFDLTRERIRQIINKLIRHVRNSGGPVVSDSLKRIAEKCLSEIIPLTPLLFVQWLESAKTNHKHSEALYFRLISELAPEIPTWSEGHNASYHFAGQYRQAEIVSHLREIFLNHSTITSLLLKKAFEQLKTSSATLEIEPREFLDILEIANNFTVDLTVPDQPQVGLAKIGVREWSRRVLAQSERPLTPEEIIEQAQTMAGCDIGRRSPYSIANALNPEDGFYLLDRRAFGLRKHFQLPERLWRKVKSDIYNLVKVENRSISTSEIINNQEFEWTNLTNPYEVAQVLREDERFTDLGRFLFALTEWGIEEREHIKDLIPKILTKDGRPMTAAKILDELQRVRSVSQSSMPSILKNTPQVCDYGFGYYGLELWGDSAKKTLISQAGFVNRVILLSDPPLTFERLCLTLEISPEGDLAESLWRTIRTLRKVTAQPSEISLSTLLSHKSWNLERALYAMLAKQNDPKSVYEIQWELKDYFGSGFGDRSLAEIEHCLEQSHLFIRDLNGEYIIDNHLEDTGADASSIRQMCLDILSNCNGIIGCDDLMGRLEVEGFELENLSSDMLAAILRGNEAFEEIGTNRFRTR